MKDNFSWHVETVCHLVQIHNPLQEPISTCIMWEIKVLHTRRLVIFPKRHLWVNVFHFHHHAKHDPKVDEVDTGMVQVQTAMKLGWVPWTGVPQEAVPLTGSAFLQFVASKLWLRHGSMVATHYLCWTVP